MTTSNSQYLAHQLRIESSLRFLESVGLPMHDAWLAHTARLEACNSEQLSDYDARYELPIDQPTIPEHFHEGQAQVLSPGHAWPGYSYTLSPGQRAWLRDNYGLTPTQTVTIITLTRWPGTRHPQVLHLRSDLHVDPRNRRHVLIDAVIRTPGKFFAESAARDAELEAERLKADLEREARGEKPKTVTKKRIVDVADYLTELESELTNV